MRNKPARMEKLLTYLNPNRDRMWYADRLRHGQTIGSGIIEGGCKNTIGATETQQRKMED